MSQWSHYSLPDPDFVANAAKFSIVLQSGMSPAHGTGNSKEDLRAHREFVNSVARYRLEHIEYPSKNKPNKFEMSRLLNDSHQSQQSRV